MWWRRVRSEGGERVEDASGSEPRETVDGPLVETRDEGFDEPRSGEATAAEDLSEHSTLLPDEPILQALEEVRRKALAIYERHKLPAGPALYRRSGERHQWRPGKDLRTPEDRWAFILEGEARGWRLVGLERAGRIGRARVIEVQLAASMLGIVERLSSRLNNASPDAREDLKQAFELGRLTAAADERAALIRRRKRLRARLKARARQIGAEPRTGASEHQSDAGSDA